MPRIVAWQEMLSRLSRLHGLYPPYEQPFQQRRSFERVNPTFASGACIGDYYSSTHFRKRYNKCATGRSPNIGLLEQDNVTLAEVSTTYE
jgi:hypothetical protein